MYSLLNKLLSDHKGSAVFSCFGVWHILYMLVIFGVVFITIYFLKEKDTKIRQRAVNTAINCAFGLYIADFFLMPFAYGQIDMEKLPFHFCTAMCVMCFLSRHHGFFGKFKAQFAMLGLISNLIYVIYPAGVGWYQIHPASYRVIQTLLFHGSMTAYGLFALAFEDFALQCKNIFKDLLVIIGVAVWALLGNTLYNGTYGDASRFFNWSFVVRDPFYLLPESIAPYVMPFLIILVYFAADILLYLAYFGVKKYLKLSGGKHGSEENEAVSV